MIQLTYHTDIEADDTSYRYRALMQKLQLVLLTLALCGSCKSHKTAAELPPPAHQASRDSAAVRVLRDSIYLHDSIHVTEKRRGDTLIITRTELRCKYRDRLRHDTIRAERRDTILRPCPVERRVEVAMPLKKWQKGLMAVGALALIALLVWIARALKKT